MTGIERLADSIKAELEQFFFPGNARRSVHLMDLAAALPL